MTTINKIMTLFVLAILALAITPRLFANELNATSFQTNNTNISSQNSNSKNYNYTMYKIEIPCAIDRSKIILPVKTDGDISNDTTYKVMCNSSAYFNQETGIYHLKKNEGYYVNVILTNDSLNKTDISEISAVTLNIYPENAKTACFTKTMNVDPNNKIKFATKFSYVHENDSETFGLENMTGLIESCGLNTKLIFQPTITQNNGNDLIIQNTGDIQRVIIDSDNSNIIAENARNKEIISNELSTKPKEQLTTASKANKERASTIFISKENVTQKVIDISQILEVNKIASNKVVGDITLETDSDVPTYVFEVRERRKLFGFIPFGKEKIIEKRISAIKEIKE
ncbi:MAG: hypothetical protein WCX82_03155 [archaeon]|jgi:hypothetical protein